MYVFSIIVFLFFFLMIRRPPRSTLSLHDALPIWSGRCPICPRHSRHGPGSSPSCTSRERHPRSCSRSEEHTSELQSLRHLVCRLLLEKKKNKNILNTINTISSRARRTQQHTSDTP